MPSSRSRWGRILFPVLFSLASGSEGSAQPARTEGWVFGLERWTPSTGQLIDVAKWNLLRYIPGKMRGAEDDKEETAKPFASL